MTGKEKKGKKVGWKPTEEMEQRNKLQMSKTPLLGVLITSESVVCSLNYYLRQVALTGPPAEQPGIHANYNSASQPTGNHTNSFFAAIKACLIILTTGSGQNKSQSSNTEQAVVLPALSGGMN